MSSSTEPSKAEPSKAEPSLAEPTKAEPTKAEPSKEEPSKTGMDENNSKALDVLKTQGSQAFVKHVFTDQCTGRSLSYSEMRQLYG